MGRSNPRVQSRAPRRVRRKFKNAAALGSLLLIPLASSAALAGQSIWQETRYSVGQLTVRLVIPERPALSRDPQGRLCLRVHPASTAIEVRAEPQTHIESCSPQRMPISGAGTTASSDLQTFLIKPI